MIVQMYCQECLETIEVSIKDVQPFIDLIKEHGYEDGDGNQYKFTRAQVEYPEKVVIYVDIKEE